MKSFFLSRRAVVLGALPAACGLSAQPDQDKTDEDVVDVRAYGASPTATPRQNSRAFAAASGAINRAGGGTLLVPPGTYRVVHQELAGRRGLGYAYKISDVIAIAGCTRPVTLIGTGAVLRAADGLKFGAFDPVTGRPFIAPRPFADPDTRGDTSRMIYVSRCTAPVRIEGFELDGNCGRYVLGGEWGDTGRQLYAVGIFLQANTGGTDVVGVNAHHHGLDGIHVDHKVLTPASPRYPVTMTDSVFDSNGRQGLSWVGGTSLTATRCRFSRTGKGGVVSAPAAGVDIEAEGSVCRNGRFVECAFVDNSGMGFLAEVGDVEGIRLERCTFVGTTMYSSWSRKPGIVFDACTFIGSIVNAFGDPDPNRATKFLRCRFVGDPSLSPTGKIYGEYLADLGAGAVNVLMRECDFNAVSPAIALPWTLPDVTYENCRFRQAGTVLSNPRGIFKGRNRFESKGLVNLNGSQFIDRVIVNGKLFP